MKFFIDTEFLEGTQEKKVLGIKYGNTKPTIDLISIGIVSEENKEYYAISKDFNLKEAWNRIDREKVYWIRQNVLKPIYKELKHKADKNINSIININNKDYSKKSFTYLNLKKLINKYGKTNKEIANEIVKFVYPNAIYKDIDCDFSNLLIPNCANSEKPEFYAYYADYDWVAFCWLFGRMIDLPKRFPMYCIDLKQIMDEKSKLIPYSYTTKEGLISMKVSKDFPKQMNEHNALADAKWNKKLYEFLNIIN